MSNIEKIKAEIERLKAENRNIRCQHNEKYCTGYDDAFSDLLASIDSLPEEKPIEKDEKIEALIARDIMEATVKRVNIDKQDKDKEEEAMLEKINYLRNLGLNE